MHHDPVGRVIDADGVEQHEGDRRAQKADDGDGFAAVTVIQAAGDERDDGQDDRPRHEQEAGQEGARPERALCEHRQDRLRRQEQHHVDEYEYDCESEGPVAEQRKVQDRCGDIELPSGEKQHAQYAGDQRNV